MLYYTFSLTTAVNHNLLTLFKFKPFGVSIRIKTVIDSVKSRICHFSVTQHFIKL